MSKPVIRQHESSHSTTGSYVVGFLLSIVLTVAAYVSVTHNLFSHAILVGVLVGLAIIQFAVQVIFFLHIRDEAQPRFRLWVLVFMALIVVIVVFGTLWIMHNLNYNMLNMSPSQENTYLHNHEGL